MAVQLLLTVSFKWFENKWIVELRLGSYSSLLLASSIFYTLFIHIVYTLHFKCMYLHLVRSKSRQSEVCFVLIALHLPFKPSLLALQPWLSQWEHKSALSERTFPSLHKTHFEFHIIPLRLHIDWNSLHFQGQLHFYVVYVWQGQSLYLRMWKVQWCRTYIHD